MCLTLCFSIPFVPSFVSTRLSVLGYLVGAWWVMSDDRWAITAISFFSEGSVSASGDVALQEEVLQTSSSASSWGRTSPTQRQKTTDHSIRREPSTFASTETPAALPLPASPRKSSGNHIRVFQRQRTLSEDISMLRLPTGRGKNPLSLKTRSHRAKTPNFFSKFWLPLVFKRG